jgi:hypothetical protein
MILCTDFEHVNHKRAHFSEFLQTSNFDSGRGVQSSHWSRADTRSVFRLVVGTWSAVTQDTQACKLCDIEHLKPWQGPGMCEVCSERVLPTKNAFWASPTLPSKSCAWECRPDFTHLDPQRYSLDVNSLWWAQGLSLGLALESRFKPNWCVPCAQKPIGPLVPVNGAGLEIEICRKEPLHQRRVLAKQLLHDAGRRLHHLLSADFQQRIVHPARTICNGS